MVERLYVVGLATVYRCWEFADGWVLSGSLHWQGRPSNKIKARKNKSGRVFILGKKYLAVFRYGRRSALYDSETFKRLKYTK